MIKFYGICKMLDFPRSSHIIIWQCKPTMWYFFQKLIIHHSFLYTMQLKCPDWTFLFGQKLILISFTWAVLKKFPLVHSFKTQTGWLYDKIFPSCYLYPCLMNNSIGMHKFVMSVWTCMYMYCKEHEHVQRLYMYKGTTVYVQYVDHEKSGYT